jgi:hypothetical protein
MLKFLESLTNGHVDNAKENIWRKQKFILSLMARSSVVHSVSESTREPNTQIPSLRFEGEP